MFETFQPFCLEITRDKYMQPGETSPEQVCRRVAAATYQFDPSGLDEGLEMLLSTRFVPGGRHLAGAGTDKRVTLINCFVMDTIDDDLADIFRVLRESALTMQQGGGIGMDFSTIRPSGALLRRTGSVASGPLLFMDTWDAMCRTVMSAGARRGAMMAVLRCDHPDIESFITAKRVAGRLTQFNVSVLVTDAFMEQVRCDGEWRLGFGIPPADRLVENIGTDEKPWFVYKTIRARELWEKILTNTYEFSEPGVIFIDRVNKLNNLSYCERIAATNPCGEQPLPPYGDCLLGAINLARFVIQPWQSGASVDIVGLARTTRAAVRFLDNVIEVTGYPLDAQKREAHQKRRIGLGVMGLANMFQQLGQEYGGAESRLTTNLVFQTIRNAAYEASVALARARGPFPAYDGEHVLASPMVKTLPARVREHLREYGIRNGVLLTVAPTGTTAIFAGNVSGGIEPVFAGEYNRYVLQPDGSKKADKVRDWGFAEWARLRPGEPYPRWFNTAQDLDIDGHMAIMAIAQQHIDASISKTINCPAAMTFDQFKAVYDRAYDTGLKGCTTYRPSEVRGAVLEVIDDKKEPSRAAVEAETVTASNHLSVAGKDHSVTVPVRPEALAGVTYKVKPSEHAYYITITDYEGQPHELFINSKDPTFSDWTAALGRLVSAIWRRGDGAGFIADELRQIHSAGGGFWLNGAYRPSLVAAIGDAIAYHTKATAQLGPVAHRVAEQNNLFPTPPTLCPRCSSPARKESGCLTCASCGYSNCG